MLPGADGWEVCRHLRARHADVPVIMLSARSAEAHRVLGLELGADDYLAKPFSMLELVARMRALLRRIEQMRPQPAAARQDCSFGPFRLDTVRRELLRDGAPVPLTLREFDLLHFLLKHPGRPFSRTELLQRVWGDGFDGYEHTVNSHINRLRSRSRTTRATPGAWSPSGAWATASTRTPASRDGRAALLHHPPVTLALAVLLLAYGAFVALLGRQVAAEQEQESLQRLSHGLARHIVGHWPEITSPNRDEAERAARGALLSMLMTVNPGVQVYLLDADGRVQHYIGEPGMVRQHQVDLAAVRAFLAGAPLPLRGTDPMGSGVPRIFSAAMFPPRPAMRGRRATCTSCSTARRATRWPAQVGAGRAVAGRRRWRPPSACW